MFGFLLQVFASIFCFHKMDYVPKSISDAYERPPICVRCGCVARPTFASDGCWFWEPMLSD